MRDILGPVLILSFTMFILMTGSASVVPILPNYARDFGVSLTVVGLVLAVNNGLRMLMGFPAGLIIDRVGRKPLISIGMAITALGAYVSFKATSIFLLFLGQGLIGIGAAFYSTASLSMVVDMSNQSNRGKATGVYMTGFHLGTVIGPGIGGWLAYRYGLESPFLLFAFLALLASFAAAVFTRESESSLKLKEVANEKISLAQALTPELFSVYFINFTFRFGFNGLMWTILPLLIAEHGFDSRVTGIVFMLLGGLSMLLFYPTGALADRFGRRKVLIPGCILGIAAFTIFLWTNTLTSIVVASILLGLSGGFISTIPAALIGDFAPAKLRGAAMGIFRSAGDFGLVFSPLTLGFFGERFGLSSTFLVTLILWSLSTASIWGQTRKRKNQFLGKVDNKKESSS